MRTQPSLERKACPSENVGGRSVHASMSPREPTNVYWATEDKAKYDQLYWWEDLRKDPLGLLPDVRLLCRIRRATCRPALSCWSPWTFLSPPKITLGETTGPSGDSSPCRWGVHFPQRLHEISQGQVWQERHSQEEAEILGSSAKIETGDDHQETLENVLIPWMFFPQTGGKVILTV